jgi:hypothetical protein
VGLGDDDTEEEEAAAAEAEQEEEEVGDSERVGESCDCDRGPLSSLLQERSGIGREAPESLGCCCDAP